LLAAKWEPTLLPVFAPKALAGIGKLPDTGASRSIRIELKRRAPGEQCERFRARIAGAVAAPLYDRLVIWAADSIETLIDARPSIPDELGDRAADVWEPLLAVADLAGGTWPGRARQAAVELSTGERIADDSIGVRLLADCRTAFGDNDRLPTIELIRSLAEDDEAPWANWYGRGQISARELANLLRRYGIASKTIRLDADRTAKGYERKQFEDAWARYLPLPPQTDPAKRHYVTTRMDAGVAGHVDPSQHDPVTDAKDGANPHGYADVTGVTDDARLVGAGPEHAFCRACSSFFCQHVAPNLYSRDPEGESP
jgi:hypothetical protein